MMVFISVILTVLFQILSSSSAYRLPTIYNINRYNIELFVPSEVFSVENATHYNGTVEIQFIVSESANEIILHASASYLNVTSASLITSDNNNINNNISNYFVNSTTDLLTLNLTEALKVDQIYWLTLKFDGNLSTTDMYGFYKSSYTNSENLTQYLITTQMEATYARRAFPCFDEPRYKAIFDISITYPDKYNVLGNMNIAHETIYNGSKTTKFQSTPILSTYLVAFIVSEFSCTEGTPVEGSLKNQVCSRNEANSTRSFAVEIAASAIDVFNSYLKINYSEKMTKLDQVAIPDFSAGAMENWGLITYRERALLYDPLETSNSYQQSIGTVITHELAHQWFGNLVTCKWWSEIFLNEGFATFFQYFAIHEFYPDWELDKQFIPRIFQYAMENDVTTTESLRTNATTPSEISERFGAVSYDKGASILRMVENILGISNWKLGLTEYLKTFANSSTEPNDLWNVLTNYVNISTLPANLTVIMNNWTNSPGYPIVNIRLTEDNQQLVFSQERFVLSNTTEKNTTWYIPVTYTTSAEESSRFLNTTPIFWITPGTDVILNISSQANVSWFVMNNLNTGYYRVNYDTRLWNGLASALKNSSFSGIPEMNRAQIVDDAFNLARNNYISYNQLFTIIAFLSNETSYTVWYSAINSFSYLLQRFGENNSLANAISDHILKLFEKALAEVPIRITNSSNHIYTLKQVLLQTRSCKLGNPICTDEAVRLFEEYKNSSIRPDKNLRAIAYCYGLKYSKNIASDWEFLWNSFLNTSLSTEEVTILSALGCPSNKTILNLYLEKTLADNTGIRSQDYASVFSAVYTGSLNGVDAALDFFIQNIHTISARYTSLNSIGSILKGIAGRITTDTQLEKLETFVSNGTLNGTLLEAANSSLTNVKRNFDWVNTYRASLNEYFGIDDNDTSTTISSTPQSTSSSSIPTISTTPPTSTAATKSPPNNAASTLTKSLSIMLILGLMIQLLLI